MEGKRICSRIRTGSLKWHGTIPRRSWGVLLIGASSVLFFHIVTKLSRAGHSISANGLGVPFAYLKVRAKHSWSPWPAYLSWLCLIAGIVLLVFGLLHLNG